MAEHLTEEEQIETLKRWWAENGKGIFTGVVLALAGYFGFQWWQEAVRAKAEAASDLYQSFVEAVSANDGQPDEKQLTTAKSLAEELKADFAGRIYAGQASLRLAALAARDNNLESAAGELQWVLDNTDEESLKLVAKRRLAAVLAARGKPDEGLVLVTGDVPPSFAALYAETRGDILLQKGDKAGARQAYQQALASLLPDQAGGTQLLQLKISGLVEQEVKEAQAEPSEPTVNEVEPTEPQAGENPEPEQESDAQ